MLQGTRKAVGSRKDVRQISGVGDPFLVLWTEVCVREIRASHVRGIFAVLSEQR